MKVQENNKGALYVYFGKADAEELGLKKGMQLRACIDGEKIILRKRGESKKQGE